MPPTDEIAHLETIASCHTHGTPAAAAAPVAEAL